VAPVVIEVRQPGTSALWLVLHERLIMGRDCDGLLLRDPQVSREHLALDVDEEGVTVTDLGSTNGTLLNGVPVVEHGRVAPGDTIAAGGTTVRVTLWDVDPLDVSHSGMTPVTVLADEAAREHIDTGPLVSTEGTVTIMFSDIESSSEMTARLGDQRWLALLREHDRIVRDCVNRHGGRVIKTQGDGFMVSFKSARAAVLAAVSIQRAMYARTKDDGEGIEAVHVRLGIHTGEAISASDGDLFGRHVVVAARIADTAVGGEILVSSLVREIALGRGDLVFGDARIVHLKGMGDHAVHQVLWSEREPA
jgi:class 3 adenylate cyclase